MRCCHAPLLFFLALAAARAQDGASAAYRAGGPGSDMGGAVAVSPDGSFVVVGEFEGTATFDSLALTAADAPAARSDVFAVKYAPGGASLWARRMGTGVSDDFAGGVDVGPAGEVVVSGYFTGVATFDGGANPDTSLTTRSGFDAFVAKYDTDGDLQWVEQGGGLEQDAARSVAVDDGGFVYAVGSFTDEGRWGDTTLVSAGSSDVFLVKYAPDGQLVWAERAGGTDSEDGRGVALGGDFFRADAAYVVGTFSGVAQFGGLPVQSRGRSDIFVVRYDTSGTPEWAQQIGGAGSDYGRGVASGDDFGRPFVYVAGSFEDEILVDGSALTSAGASDALLAILSEDGGLRNLARGGGTGYDAANDVALTQACYGDICGGAAVVAGYTDGEATFEPADYEPGGFLEVAGLGGSDGFIAGADDSGFYAVESLGGSGADRGYGVGAPQYSFFDMPVLTTGSFRGSGTFNGIPLASAGGDDVFVTVFQPCDLVPCFVGTEPGPIDRLALSLATPNPFRDRVTSTLTLDTPAHVHVEVFDALGRRVALLHDGVLGAGTHPLTFNGRGQPTGTYLLRVSNGDSAAHRALVLTR